MLVSCCSHCVGCRHRGDCWRTSVVVSNLLGVCTEIVAGARSGCWQCVGTEVAAGARQWLLALCWLLAQRLLHVSDCWECAGCWHRGWCTSVVVGSVFGVDTKAGAHQWLLAQRWLLAHESITQVLSELPCGDCSQFSCVCWSSLVLFGSWWLLVVCLAFLALGLYLFELSGSYWCQRYQLVIVDSSQLRQSS